MCPFVLSVNRMKTNFLKIFSLLLILVLTVFSFNVSAQVDPKEPTAKLYLGEPVLKEKNGKSYVTIDVLIDDNTADLFVVSYRVISKDKLTPVNFDNGSFSEAISNDFGEEKLTLSATDTINPSSITSKKLTGIQVLQDSSSGLKGISAKSGVLGTAWFEAPAKDGTYTFALENLGCNNVYSDDTGKLNVGTYKVSLGSEVQFIVGEGTPSSQLTQICDEHKFTIEVDGGKKCEDCDTVKRNDGSIRYPVITVTDDTSSEGGTSQNAQPQEDKNSKALGDYVLPLLSALVITAIIIVSVIVIIKRKKK